MPENPEVPEPKPAPPRPAFQRRPLPTPERPQQSSRWEAELQKAIGREVVVHSALGNDHLVFEGVLVAVQFNHLSVILRTPTEKIVVKMVHHISRKRSFNEGRDGKPPEAPDA